MLIKNRTKIFFSFIIIAIAHISFAKNIELTISNPQHTKMPIAIMVLDKNNKELIEIAQIIKKDLAFTDQFAPRITMHDQSLTKKELRATIKQLAHTNTSLALCLNTQSPEALEYHLYDTIECKALQAKRYKTKKSVPVCAHTIADQARKTLTGHDPLFLSQIAYCKDTGENNGKTTRKIYIADYDGTNERVLVDSSAMIIAPRWHRKKPELFFSEFTPTSIQLKSAEIKKQSKPITNGKNVSHFQDGVNMMVDFDPEGNSYAFCASRGSGNCQIYLNRDGALKKCTNNNGNNDCPVFIDKERLCFCSNFQTGSPQIYIGNISTGHLQRITHGGYCSSPAYCPKTNRIAYLKMIGGIMQVISYDSREKTHTQLTHDAGNKQYLSFSPDGTFLLYNHEGPDNSSRLKTFNLLTKTTKYLTPAHECCSYPQWSPLA